LNDYPCKTDWFENDDHATVCTHNDSLSSIDLRYLVGLTVSISAASESRAKALFSLVREAGAGVVAACHVKADKHQFEQDGWTEVFRKEAA
jgi:hypothetical protein